MNNYMKPIVSSLKQWVAEYIKNYPSADEAVDMLIDMGFVELAYAEDGAVYTDGEAIFVL